MSHNLYSVNSVYDIVDGNESFDYPDIDTAIHLTENSYIYNISLPRQYTEDNDTDITYYPNIDRVLTNTYNSGYLINGKDYYDDVKVYSTAPVSMKYKSSSHIVIALKSDDEGIIPIMPKALVETSSDSKAVIGEYDKTVGSKKAYETFWGDVMQFSQKTFDATAIFEVTKKALISYILENCIKT